jgi:putative nucleotidyltransferase with HDIG domain
MPASVRLPTTGRIFVGLVVMAGAVALLDCLYRLWLAPTNYHWLVLAGLTLFSGSFTIKVPSIPATISVSETFVFACVLLFGTPAATVTVALDGLIMSSWRHRQHLHKVLFNATEPALSIYFASELFFLTSGIRPLSEHSIDVSTIILPILVLATAYFLLNSWLTALAVSFETASPVLCLWRDHFLWLSLNYFVGASVAALIVRNTTDISFATLGVILPLLLISYLTFKTSLGRVTDADQHLAELNRLHVSTVETLAMAIDAKDQVTHGHIRRVQEHAVALAGSLGIKDQLLLKAIEAAALLHDMGKLAVPERILNKPGRLTPGEFEEMKTHASVGADILSAIEFPYPVVPIVRHHHENWDGSGYPAGLSGLDIPIGARILAVVDCYDALTSDRPYRERLSEEKALAIMVERRGTMYDPLIIDAFLRLCRRVDAQDEAKDPADALAEIARSARTYGLARPRGADQDRQDGLRQSLLLHSREALGDSAPNCGTDIKQSLASRPSGSDGFVGTVYWLDVESGELTVLFGTGTDADAPPPRRLPASLLSPSLFFRSTEGVELDVGETSLLSRSVLHGALLVPLLLHRVLAGAVVLQIAKQASHETSLTLGARHERRLVSGELRALAGRLPADITVESGVPYIFGVGDLQAQAEQTEALGGVALVRVDRSRSADGKVEAKRAQALATRAAAILGHLIDALDVVVPNGSELLILLAANRPIRPRLARLQAAVTEIALGTEAAAPGSGGYVVRIGSALSPLDGRSSARLLKAAREHLDVPALGQHCSIDFSAPVQQHLHARC